eukprot:jgi/Ulvmu1/4927/UM203_0006.1
MQRSQNTKIKHSRCQRLSYNSAESSVAMTRFTFILNTLAPPEVASWNAARTQHDDGTKQAGQESDQRYDKEGACLNNCQKIEGRQQDGFHNSSEPKREVTTLEHIDPRNREQAIEELQEKVGEAFAGWEWDEVEENADVDVLADEPGRYEVKCTYHDGGEFCHATLERTPARTATPAHHVLSIGQGAVTKAAKGKKASSGKGKGIEFVWVLTREMGYHSDGFHAPEDPTTDIVATVPDGPDGKENAIDLLEEKAGEIWAGDGWDALVESSDVDYEDDTPDRYSVLVTPMGDGEYCRWVVERRESTPALLKSTKPQKKRGTDYAYNGIVVGAY